MAKFQIIADVHLGDGTLAMEVFSICDCDTGDTYLFDKDGAGAQVILALRARGILVEDRRSAPEPEPEPAPTSPQLRLGL